MQKKQHNAQPNTKSPLNSIASGSTQTILQLQQLTLQDKKNSQNQSSKNQIAIAEDFEEQNEQQSRNFHRKEGLFSHQTLSTQNKNKNINKFRNKRDDNTKKRHNLHKKIEVLNRKNSQLEKQIQYLRRMYEYCPQCHYSINERRYINSQLLMLQEQLAYDNPYIQNYDGGGVDKNRRSSKDSVQFQQMNFSTPLQNNSQMQEKSWILLGTIMIAMGAKIMDVDGTIDVFKILKQSVDNIRRQVDKEEKQIILDFYMSKEQLENEKNSGSDLFWHKDDEIQKGLQLQAVRIESVEQCELFYHQKVKFHVKYESLITIMEYARQNCMIS